MAKHIQIDLRDRSKEDYEIIAGLVVQVLEQIANTPLSDEVDPEELEDGWGGLSFSECLEMQHDNHVFAARQRLQHIARDGWKEKA